MLCRGGERVAVPRERAEKCAFLLGILEECEADDAAGPLTVQAPLVEAPRLEAVLRILGGERAGAGMCVCTCCTMLYHAQSATCARGVKRACLALYQHAPSPSVLY